MAITANKKQDTYEYVPITERGDKHPFTVKIHRILPRQFTILEDKMAKVNKDESISFTTGTFNWEILKKGVIGWSNLLDEKGVEIAALRNGLGEVLDTSLDLLPLSLITEIANVIVGVSKDPDNASVYLGSINETAEAK